ncbi:MAG TPA: acyltransferase [Methylotenera sp.]|nr:acyltransferase [Methylotenera sp.]HPH04753.1 acyltransferase [Methylotenera sp.]HPN01196.1 acyltransferase [Methylotenera sp.]
MNENNRRSSLGWELGSNKNDTSITLDLLRVIASFAVFFGHGIDFMEVGAAIKPPNFPYMQNFGVLVFFILSGFLIAYTLNKGLQKGESFRCYLINRFSRIYSGLVPCLGFIVLLSVILVMFGLHPTPNDVTLGVTVNNFLLLNGSPLKVSHFPLSGQLWTLPLEFHLYVFAGGIYYFLTRTNVRALFLACLFSYFPYFYFQTGPTGSNITLLWLGGFYCYFVGEYLNNFKYKNSVVLLMLLSVLMLVFYLVVPSREYDLRIYPLVMLAFLMLLLLTQTTNALIRQLMVVRVIRYVADFSFSLYLIHYPILYLINLNTEIRGWLGMCVCAFITITLAVVLSHFGERHHKKIASTIKKLLEVR